MPADKSNSKFQNCTKMKKLKVFKLNKLSNDELNARRMNALKGGTGCACVWCLCSGGDEYAADNTDAGGGYIASVVSSWC